MPKLPFYCLLFSLLHYFMSALIVVDLQNDFIDGSLAVKDASAVVEPILKLMDFNWDVIIATQDWHPKDHCSFASQHPGAKDYSQMDFTNPNDPKEVAQRTVWPDHCVQDSHGAQLETKFGEKFDILLFPTKLVRKGSDRDREYYSCFRDTWKQQLTGLTEFLHSRGIRRVVLVGLAYDFCVLHSALDASEMGFYTYVIKDSTRSIDSSNDANTDAKYKQGGVHLIQANELHSMGLDIALTVC